MNNSITSRNIDIIFHSLAKRVTRSIFNETSPSSATTRDLLIIQCLSIYALILILVGTVGNFLTIVTLLRRNLRRLVTIRYLIVVSICDTISLYGWNLNSFYKFNISLQNDNLEEISIVHCRIFSYMTFVSLQLSSWCLTAVSLDRALNLYWPLWKQSYGKLKYTKYYIGFLTLICLTLNSHILFLNGYRQSTGEIKCYSTRDNAGYIYPQWERVHLVVYNLCPFALMCICNSYIIVVTVRSSRNQPESTSVFARKQLERYRQLTALLILVTFAFVLLTLPACIYFVFFRHQLELTTERTHRYMIQISVNSIQFTSHAINFFLYCFSAKTFLNEFNDMFNECLAFCQCHDINDDDENDDDQDQLRQIEQRQHQDENLYQESTFDRQQRTNYQFRFYPEFQTMSEQRGTWT